MGYARLVTVSQDASPGNWISAQKPVPSGTTESSPGRSPGSWISAQKTVPSGTTENAQDAVLLLLDPVYIEKLLHFFGKTIPPMMFLLSFDISDCDLPWGNTDGKRPITLLPRKTVCSREIFMNPLWMKTPLTTARPWRPKACAAKR
jgi:hypothetical protein